MMTNDEVFYAIDDEINSLSHYGIKGQKWGIRRTPEQLGNYIKRVEKKMAKNISAAKKAKERGDAKTLAQLNRKTLKYKTKISKAKGLMEQAIIEQEENKRKRKEENEAREREKRNEFLKTASVKDVLNRQNEFSIEEINNFINRKNILARLNELQNNEKENGIKRAESFIESFSKIGTSALKSFDTYKKVAKTVNEISGSDKLPTFEKKTTNKKVDDIVKSLDVKNIINNDELSLKEMENAFERLSKIGEMSEKARKATNLKQSIKKEEEKERLEKRTS